MEKIQVKLCAGPMCYIMGDTQLTEVSEKLTDKAKESVEISLASCLGYGDKRKNSICGNKWRADRKCK